MSLRDTAKYAFGLVFGRFMPLNDDLTIPSPSRIIGGAGPFDFSGVTDDSAIPMSFKFDNGNVETISVDLSAAADPAAVTVDELFAAINTETPTDILASKDGATGRLKLAYTGTDNPIYLQVYGECAEIAMIGQGKGCKFIVTDTLKSVSETPTRKDTETLGISDANGLDTEILTDGYRKGFTGNVVDTAEDWALRSLIEGGHYIPRSAGPPVVQESYSAPTSEDPAIYFYIEAYYKKYERGTQKEGDLVGYVQKFHRSCKGSIGDGTHERAFREFTYPIQGTTYTDENDNLLPDTKLTEMTVEEYQALDVLNV